MHLPKKSSPSSNSLPIPTMKTTRLCSFIIFLLSTSALIAQSSNRLLSKLADDDERQGVYDAKHRSYYSAHTSAVYKEVLEDASTGATLSFASAVEFRKKSNESTKQPITVGAYITFLKAVAVKRDLHGLYTSSMASQILQKQASDHSYYYFITDGAVASQPLFNATLADARRYCNWLDCDSLQPTAAEKSTEMGSYDFSDDGLVSIIPEAKYHLSNENENAFTFSIVTQDASTPLSNEF